MSKPTVYLETTIPSYLTARISPQIVTAAKQQITREWWATQRSKYRLFISAAVEDESRCGHADAVQLRLKELAGIPSLDITPAAIALAKSLAHRMNLSQRKQTDALHISVAACNQMDFLLTWNCTHINNAQLLPKVEAICAQEGYRCPVICTPAELS